jgi:hypothetical protein
MEKHVSKGTGTRGSNLKKEIPGSGRTNARPEMNNNSANDPANPKVTILLMNFPGNKPESVTPAMYCLRGASVRLRMRVNAIEPKAYSPSSFGPEM